MVGCNLIVLLEYIDMPIPTKYADHSIRIIKTWYKISFLFQKFPSYHIVVGPLLNTSHTPATGSHI